MRRTLLVLPVFAFACTTATADVEDADRLEVTPVESQALLSLLNDAATTVEFLDVEVGLSSRAARNIITARNGADGVYPSPDDHRFDTLEEVETVKYVGAATMQLLHDYVVDHPAPAGTLVEGVEFTAVEAAAVLWGVNSASVEELDFDVALSSTAARSLIEHAPYDDMAALAAAPGVGQATLLALRGYAANWSDISALAGTFDGVAFDGREAADTLELANHATFEDFVAVGIQSSAAHAIVDHRPYASMDAVAAVTGVGPSTMTKLKAM